jgi:serine incorporator 1/3
MLYVLCWLILIFAFTVAILLARIFRICWLRHLTA